MTEDVVGVPLLLAGVKWLESTYAEGPRVFAVVEAARSDGERLTITTGASTILAQLYRINQLGGFPLGARFTKASKATHQGFYPMWLEPADPTADF
ncbi:MAG: hypothetical protein LC798_05355 [Chloroflexi bacterium]|nr:hypothetical protein [Chloroflexota bacterium]